MFGYIAAYVGGIATGIFLIWMNRRSVETALAKQQKRYDAQIARKDSEISRLKEDYSAVERSLEARDIRAKGRAEGIDQGKRMSAVEQFSHTLDRHNVQFRETTKTA